MKSRHDTMFDFLPRSENPVDPVEVLATKGHYVQQLYKEFLYARENAIMDGSTSVVVSITHKGKPGFVYQKNFDCTFEEMKIIATEVEKKLPESHRCFVEIKEYRASDYGWNDVVFTPKNKSSTGWW